MRILPFLSGAAGLLAAVSLRAQSVPSYDHVVVVMLENHSYSEVLDEGSSLPFINDFLRAGGANITQAWGLQHPSQPNYYWLFSGANQGIASDDSPLAPSYTAPNLYSSLAATPGGLTFGGYVDGYPGAGNLYPTSATGYQVEVAGNIGNETSGTSTISYVSRHVPWLGFTGIPTEVTHDFSTFGTQAADFAALPTVSFVIPALENDMHNYATDAVVGNIAESGTAMLHSDQWLEANLKAYAQWAQDNNSLLIITTDEDSTADWSGTAGGALNYHGSDPVGLTSPDAGFSESGTNPNGTAQSGPNQITTIFYGAGIQAGNYAEGDGISNVNVLRTIEAIYGLAQSGAQSGAYPATIGDGAITDIFVVPEPGSMSMLVLGLGSLLFLRHRQRKSGG
ncbi:phosphatidylinositol-3-phosphatase [soil metagenome]